MRIHFAAPIPNEFLEPKQFVTLRRPRIGEIIDIGDPLAFVVGEQASMPVVDRTILAQWFAALVADHSPDVLRMQEDVHLGLMIEDAILGFFQNARRALRQASAPSSVAASA